jgi:transcriptional regulator with XRE-family HTH domain
MARSSQSDRPLRPHFIAAWRAAKKLSQAELGKRIGRSEATISRIEAGKQPYTQDTLEAIGAALGTDPDQLIRNAPGRSMSEGILDPQILEISIAVALQRRSHGELAQIARASRLFYGFLIEAKARGEVVNNETAAQILLDKLAEQEGI